MPKTKILFICHGNICRSPMAEFVFKHLAREAGVADRFEVASAAVSSEETGNDIYPPAKRMLREQGVPFTAHAAHRITPQEFASYHKVICADRSNLRWLASCLRTDTAEFGTISPADHVSLMMQWADENRDVADPWYTGDFHAAYHDIHTACTAILHRLAGA